MVRGNKKPPRGRLFGNTELVLLALVDSVFERLTSRELCGL